MAPPSFASVGKEVKSPSRLAHFVLKTSFDNFRPLINFYKTFLGGWASYDDGNAIAFLTYDDEHHRIGIVARPGIKPLDELSSGLVHTAFGYSTLADLMTAYLQRKANEIPEPHACVNHGPTTSLYYKDPDGNELETFVDNLDTPEEAQAVMETELFAQDPMGIYFKPEELIKRLESGEDEESCKSFANMKNLKGRTYGNK